MPKDQVDELLEKYAGILQKVYDSQTASNDGLSFLGILAEFLNEYISITHDFSKQDLFLITSVVGQALGLDGTASTLEERKALTRLYLRKLNPDLLKYDNED